MTRDEIATKMQESGAWVPNKVVKLDFGSDGVIRLDGTAKTVSREDGPADATVTVSLEDLKALAKGELNPMTAFMSGRIKIDGDMSVAMQLQSVLGSLSA